MTMVIESTLPNTSPRSCFCQAWMMFQDEWLVQQVGVSIFPRSCSRSQCSGLCRSHPLDCLNKIRQGLIAGQAGAACRGRDVLQPARGSSAATEQEHTTPSCRPVPRRLATDQVLSEACAGITEMNCSPVGQHANSCHWSCIPLAMILAHAAIGVSAVGTHQSPSARLLRTYCSNMGQQ